MKDAIIMLVGYLVSLAGNAGIDLLVGNPVAWGSNMVFGLLFPLGYLFACGRRA